MLFDNSLNKCLASCQRTSSRPFQKGQGTMRSMPQTLADRFERAYTVCFHKPPDVWYHTIADCACCISKIIHPYILLRSLHMLYIKDHTHGNPSHESVHAVYQISYVRKSLSGVCTCCISNIIRPEILLRSLFMLYIKDHTSGNPSQESVHAVYQRSYVRKSFSGVCSCCISKIVHPYILLRSQYMMYIKEYTSVHPSQESVHAVSLFSALVDTTLDDS